MAAKFRVHIKKRGGVTTAVVRPPFDFSKSGEKVEVVNKTKDKILVMLPAEFGILPFEIAAGEDEKKEVPEKIEDGAYDFRIFSFQTFSVAQASSDPEIIIEA